MTSPRIDITSDELDALCEFLNAALVVIGRIKQRRNAYATNEKVIANDSHAGRPRKRNDKRIRKLRARGHTIRAIAMLEGISTTAVQRSIHEGETP